MPKGGFGVILKVMQAPLHPIAQALLVLQPELKLVYLFGSHETEYEKASSDIDVAVLPRVAFGALRCFELQEKLSLLLKRDVDMIDLSTASTVMRFEIVAKGRLLYAQDENTRVSFEGLAVSMYLRFEEERRHIIENFIGKKKHDR